MLTHQSTGEIYILYYDGWGIGDCDATPRVFQTGEEVTLSHTFTIPEDLPDGSYDMYFFFFGVKAEFQNVIAIDWPSGT